MFGSKMAKRIFATCLSVVLVVGLLPASAFADGSQQTGTLQAHTNASQANTDTSEAQGSALATQGSTLAAQAHTLSAQAAAKPFLEIGNVATGKLTLKKGARYKLGAKASSGAKIAYKSSKQKTVSVTKKGVLKAKKTGKANVTVTAKAGKAKAVKKIKVNVVTSKKYKQVKKITAKTSSTSLAVGKTTKVSVSFKPAKASNKNVVFSSSNTSVASVSATGVITAKKAGTATITAKSCANSKAKATIKITVKSATPVNPLQKDSDGDGIPDYIEVVYMGTDPNSPTDLSSDDLPEKVIYAQGVSQVSAADQVKEATLTATDTSLTLSNLPADAKVGGIVVAPASTACPAGAAIKINSITQNSDGTYTLEGTQPDLGEVLDYGCIDEDFQLDLDNIELEDGCEIEEINTLSAQANDGSEFKPKEFEISIGEKDSESGSTGNDDKGKLSGSVKVNITGGHAKVVTTGSWLSKAAYTTAAAAWAASGHPVIGAVKYAQQIDYADVAVRGTLTPSVKYTLGLTKKEKEINLARIPLIGAFWTGGYLELKLVAKIDGTIAFKTNINFDFGAIYNKNATGDKLKTTGTGAKVDTPEVTLEVDGKLGFKLKPTAKLLGMDLISAGVEVGGNANVKETLTTGCKDVRVGLYGELYGELLGFLSAFPNIKLKVTWQFLKPEKVGVNWHIEGPITNFSNWKLNGTCTKKNDENQNIPDISGVTKKTSLDAYSWAELKSIANAIAAAGSDASGIALAKKYNLVTSDGKLEGATKSLTLTDGTNTSVRIAGFRHDDKTAGGKAGITFEFADVPTTHKMNSTDTNEGGWAASEMRSWLNSDFYNLLPAGLRAHITAASKKTNNKGEIGSNDPSVVSAYSDKLWLLSMSEVYGQLSSYSSSTPSYPAVYDAEGTQYQFYADKGVTTSNYSFCEKAGAYSWWLLRSPGASGSHTFHRVSGYGRWDYHSADDSLGVSPGFCF